MQIKKEDARESVDVSADKVDLVKSLATNMSNESSFMLPTLNGNSGACGGGGRHLSTSRPDQLHTNGPTENQKLLCPHLHKDLYHRDRGP